MKSTPNTSQVAAIAHSSPSLWNVPQAAQFASHQIFRAEKTKVIERVNPVVSLLCILPFDLM